MNIELSETSTYIFSAILGVFGLFYKRMNEMNGDLIARIDKKVDKAECMKEHENDNRTLDRIEDMNLVLTKIMQTVARIDEYIELQKKNRG